MKKALSILWILFCIVCLQLFVHSCEEKIQEKENKVGSQKFVYKNHSDTAKYIGADQCKKCHQSIYNQYMQTEMGHSLKKASLENSVANFHDQSPIYDSFKNMYYQPIEEEGKLFIKEFRLDEYKKDTLYVRTEEIDYIIGSGQHTNSHLMQVNGYVNQMPLTFYAQKKEWHLPPGFEKGGNTSFDRTIEVECMTCHNGFAKYVEGSKNKYSHIPEGIDCERCHGPGSIHMKEKMAGNIVDISKQVDYSIVNPKKLSPELQMDVCQRCHLQGISVLKEGKTFYDFRPGMQLNEVFEVYQSRFTDSLSSFLMASHPDRLRMSNCYIESNKGGNENGLTCITCHNPHVSVRDVKPDYFNGKCTSCHQEKKCTEDESKRVAKDNSCIMCHMNKSASYDIPHVNITDHKISKFPVVRNVKKEDFTKSEYEKQKDFVRLVCRTSDSENYKYNAKAYLNYFEKYAQNPDLLKTAEENLKKYEKQNELFDLYVRLYFLRNNYSSVVKYSNNRSPKLINDEWTSYRIGQSFMHLKKYDKSLIYLKRAVEIAPHDIQFSQKLANNYINLQQVNKAEDLLYKLVQMYPNSADVQNDLGYVVILQSKGDMDVIKSSEKYFLKALQLNPDLVSALENITSYYYNIGNKQKATQFLQRLLKIDPNKKEYVMLGREIDKL